MSIGLNLRNNLHEELLAGKEPSQKELQELKRNLATTMAREIGASILPFRDLVSVPRGVAVKHRTVRYAAENFAQAVENFYREVGKYDSDGKLKSETSEDVEPSFPTPGTAASGPIGDFGPAHDEIPKDSPRCDCTPGIINPACPIHPGNAGGSRNIPPEQATREDQKINPPDPSHPDCLTEPD